MTDNLDKADDFCNELTLVDLVVIQDTESLASELFYEIIKPKPVIAADKSLPYIASDEKCSLGEYPQKLLDRWKNNRNIIIYKNDNQLRNFIRQARNNEIAIGKMYFGQISKELAERIKKEVGLNMDVDGYNLSISANEIRKIFKDHGSESTEAPRGQRAIIEDDIVNIPLIVQVPDKIKLSDESYRGKPTIIFIKTINGRTSIVSYVSTRSHDLRVQTMYSEKKLAPGTAVDAQASTETSETSNGTEPATYNIENS